MKIAFTTTHAQPIISGVWSRVKTLALELIKQGHEVHIFCSQPKGEKDYEIFEKIHLHRYPIKYKVSENVSFWISDKLKQDLINLSPDIIDCQSYRHPESNFVAKLKRQRKIKSKIFLTCHGSEQIDRDRGLIKNILIKIYDFLKAKKILNSFDKIKYISKNQKQRLIELGTKQEKLIYKPNPISQEYFSKTKKAKQNSILFLGRISEIKNLETLIKSLVLLKNKPLLNIVGPAEKQYKQKLENLIKKLNLQKQIKFHEAIYDLKQKIKLIDSHEIFVLPSKREGLPISLIESMARGKLCISSKTKGGLELIQDKKNGFLFDVRNEKHLAQILYKIQNMPEEEKDKIQKEARKSAEEFKIEKVMKKYGD